MNTSSGYWSITIGAFSTKHWHSVSESLLGNTAKFVQAMTLVMKLSMCIILAGLEEFF